MDYCVLVCTLRLGDLLDIQLYIISCFVNFNDLNAGDGFDLLLKMFSVVVAAAVFWSNLNMYMRYVCMVSGSSAMELMGMLLLQGSVRENQMQLFHLQMLISWLCPLAP